MTLKYLLCLLVLAGCSASEGHRLVKLGDLNAQQKWVYLGGLTDTFESPQETRNREILDQTGRELGLCFLAIKPIDRCTDYGNKLCWPHETGQKLTSTMKSISRVLGIYKPSGWIGFSNGAFFLNQLVQSQALHVPVIAIAGGGYIHDAPWPNKVYQMIGKDDRIHFPLAKKFYAQSFGTKIKMEFIPFEGGHELDKAALFGALARIK